MRAIVVDDEQIMLKRFERLSKDIKDLHIACTFESAADALLYAADNPVDIAFIDIELPVMNGIDLAMRLREIRSDILIVFVTAYDDYVWQFNRVGGDYYILKPYTKETLDMAMDKIRLMARRQQKRLYIQTFGRFVVKEGDRPLPLTGKAKEILALVVTRRGKEISNEEIYSTIWEGREYNNEQMSVFYNALGRLRRLLKKEGCENLLITTPHGQMINTDMFDCDYYAWQDGNMGERDLFDGEFMSEYSWGEYILATIADKEGE